MARNKRLLHCLRAVIAVQLVAAQDAKCYYPNGKEAPEKPCSSADGSACCPDKWQCLDNGLCHYPPDNLFGSYSCTDKSWKAEGCPSNLCTYDMTRLGGEAITQCKDHNNQWCCNADATHVNCCKEEPNPRPFFVLQDGKPYATVGSNLASSAPNLASITGLAESSGGSNPSATPPPSSSPPKPSDKPSDNPSNKDPSSSQTNASPTKPTSPIFSLETHISSGTAGISTIVVTSIVQPAASSTSTPASPPQTSSNSKVGVIVGCAVGIPLGLALIGILTWLFRKQRNQNKSPPYSSTPDPYGTGTDMSPEFAGGAKLHKPTTTTYKHDTGVPELAGQGVGPGRPVSTIQGKAELESGSAFAQGAVPYAPNLVGVGGGNGVASPNQNAGTLTPSPMQMHTPQSSWGSAPPGYSPGMNQNAWAPAATAAPQGMAEAMDTSVQHHLGAVGPGPGAPAQQTGGGRYIPYRPPPGHAASSTGSAGAGLQNVPEMAELSTVRTPPA